MVSSIGKTVFAAYAAIILTNVVVLALAARVNMFQDFFYVADKFPFILSIVTLAVALLLLVFDLGLSSAYTARAQFQIGVLALFSVFWLGFNAFSSSRWKHVPMSCSSIPSDYPDTRAWCHDLQALQAFVWLNWILLSVAALATVRFSVRQHQKGLTHIWRVPLSRFSRTVTDGHARRPTVDMSYAFGGGQARFSFPE